MAVPYIAISVSSDDLLTESPTWSEVTSYARSFSFKRGRERELEAVQVGKGSLVCSAADRELDPLNTASSFWPIRPMMHVKVELGILSTLYPVMRGFIDGYSLKWAVDWADSYAEVQFDLVDAIAVLSGTTIPSGTSYSAESAEARITSILDDINTGWPAGLRRGIGTDGYDCLARTYTDDQNAWALCQEAMGTGFADRPLWVDAGGKITSGDGVESGRIFGDGGGSEQTYSATAIEFNTSQLSNRIVITSDGFSGLTARSGSTPGPLDFGPRTYERSTLNVSNADCTALANAILPLREFPHARPDALIVRPGNDTNLWLAVLQLDVEDIITVIRRPPGGGDNFENRFRVSSVEWNIPGIAVADTTVTYRLAGEVFPTTPILSDFSSAGGPPPTGFTNWVAAGLVATGGQCAPSGTGLRGGYWTTAMTGADVEVYIDIAVEPSSGGSSTLVARLDTGTTNAYMLVLGETAPDALTLQRMDAGVSTTLDSTTQELAAGDAYGIRCVGQLIEGWVRLDGIWTRKLSAEDATYAGTGSNNKLALLLNDSVTTARYDNFGGGVVAVH